LLSVINVQEEYTTDESTETNHVHKLANHNYIILFICHMF